jgi:hypothetical protein
MLGSRCRRRRDRHARPFAANGTIAADGAPGEESGPDLATRHTVIEAASFTTGSSRPTGRAPFEQSWIGQAARGDANALAQCRPSNRRNCSCARSCTADCARARRGDLAPRVALGVITCLGYLRGPPNGLVNETDSQFVRKERRATALQASRGHSSALNAWGAMPSENSCRSSIGVEMP